jgi:CSLREA domain-containing protein
MRSAIRSRFGILAVAVTLAASVALVVAPEGSAALAASTFVVNTTTDSHDAVPGDGTCADAAGMCSLRAAAEEANDNIGTDNITVPAGTYTFAIASRIVFSDNIAVTGAGSGVTTIDADGLSGVFGVDNRAALPSLRIAGLTITGGDGLGGGIHVGSGSLNLFDSTVTGNTGPRGGGIFNDIGAASIFNSVIHDNVATDGSGGGIVIDRGTMYVTNSTISDNVATAASGFSHGGGVRNNAVLVITNSTVSGNSGDMGGGIYNADSGMLTLVHSTVANNSAGNPGAGGGIYNDGGSMTLEASILDGNMSPVIRTDCFSTLAPTSGGSNFVGDGTGCSWVAGSGDIVGTAAAPLSAGLGALQDNGGPTKTHALLPGPPVTINTIPAASCMVATDQRGVVRPQGNMCDKGAFELTVPVTVGLVDPGTGVWRLRNNSGVVTQFFYGVPGDYPFVGDWDCDGEDTPGLYRQSDGFAYLRNSNSQGIADLTFFFGNPGDVPIAGDFNGNGCDTLSIYRPSEARFYIINQLGQNGGGLGAAEYSFLFGNQGDKPVVGDWDGDGVDEIGLHRESSGFFYYRNTLSTGIADGQFYFGDPGDRFVAGDWGVVDGADTPGLFRPSNVTFDFRHTLTQGNADDQFTWTGAGSGWLPVAGDFNLD